MRFAPLTLCDAIDRPVLRQDNVPGFGGDRAVQIIENEFGKPIDQIFDSFEKDPIAAASLGQVRKRS